MARNREPVAGLFGLFGVGMAVCCGLPILLGAGVAVGAAGFALGGGVVIAVGIALGVWGWRRGQRHRYAVPPQQADASSVRPPDEAGQHIVAGQQTESASTRRTDADHR